MKLILVFENIFSLVGNQSELEAMDFSANKSQTNFHCVKEIINDTFRTDMIHLNSQSDSGLAFTMTPFLKGLGYVLIHVYNICNCKKCVRAMTLTLYII